jgi:hypothetical protein
MQTAADVGYTFLFCSLMRGFWVFGYLITIFHRGGYIIWFISMPFPLLIHFINNWDALKGRVQMRKAKFWELCLQLKMLYRKRDKLQEVINDGMFVLDNTRILLPLISTSACVCCGWLWKFFSIVLDVYPFARKKKLSYNTYTSSHIILIFIRWW